MIKYTSQKKQKAFAPPAQYFNGFFFLPVFIMIFFIFIVPCITFGQTADKTPDKEKRSCIQTVHAYAYLSENMTLSQTRTAAFANARRQAVEMAKTYISSKTKVKDLMTEYDLIFSESEGTVTVLAQKDYGVENNTRYHVWIKAEVEYGIKPKGKSAHQDPEKGTILKSGLLTVSVWTKKKIYKKNEPIHIYIQGNRDFYARIVNIDLHGNIIQLLPNDYRQINFFKGGQTYSIPDAGDRFDLKVSPPFGKDKIVVYASEVPLGNVEMESAGQGLNLYRGTVKSFAAKTRGITVASKDTAKPFKAEFYEALWVINTKER